MIRIEETDWEKGAFVPQWVTNYHSSTIPWLTVEEHPNYECRYFPYNELSVRNKESKVECIHKWYDLYDINKGKYVVLWKDGERIKIPLTFFEKYKGGNK